MTQKPGAGHWPAPLSRAVMLTASTREDPASCEESTLRLPVAIRSLGFMWHTGTGMQHAQHPGYSACQCQPDWAAGAGECPGCMHGPAPGVPQAAPQSGPGYGGA